MEGDGLWTYCLSAFCREKPVVDPSSHQILNRSAHHRVFKPEAMPLFCGCMLNLHDFSRFIKTNPISYALTSPYCLKFLTLARRSFHDDAVGIHVISMNAPDSPKKWTWVLNYSLHWMCTARYCPAYKEGELALYEERQCYLLFPRRREEEILKHSFRTSHSMADGNTFQDICLVSWVLLVCL